MWLGALFQPFSFPVQTELMRMLAPLQSKKFEDTLTVSVGGWLFFLLMYKWHVEKHSRQVFFPFSHEKAVEKSTLSS